MPTITNITEIASSYHILNAQYRCMKTTTRMASDTFGELDAFLFRPLFRWGMRRHGDKGKKWVASRYWHPRGGRKWEFCTENEALFRPIDVKMKRHVKIRNSTNPYIDTEYFRTRQKGRRYERGYRDKSFAV